MINNLEKINNMEKDFVNYDIALEMKQLGFDEPCFAVYENKKWFLVEVKNEMSYESCLKLDVFPAPTFSQCFRFFREKYKLHQNIEQYYGEKFYFNIKDMVHPRRWDEYPVKILKEFNESDSQEEAELAAIVKLIEIVKEKKK